MIADIVYAIEKLPAAIELVSKLAKIVTSKTPADIGEEIARLELARLRSSDDIIAEADKEK